MPIPFLTRPPAKTQPATPQPANQLGRQPANRQPVQPANRQPVQPANRQSVCQSASQPAQPAKQGRVLMGGVVLVVGVMLAGCGGGGGGGGSTASGGGGGRVLPNLPIVMAGDPCRRDDPNIRFINFIPSPPLNSTEFETQGNHLRHLANCLGKNSTVPSTDPADYVDNSDVEFNSQQGFRLADSGSSEERTYNGPGHNPVYLHGFHHAYARGWTGNGSVVAVADSGIWLDHPDLMHLMNNTNKNITYKNFLMGQETNSSEMRRQSYHGTFIAGIIAGERDGGVNNDTFTFSSGMTTFNMHGVAFDANLAVLKIGTGENVQPRLLNGADGGYDWARQQGAVAITHSFGTPPDKDYIDNLEFIRSGEWYSNHDTYGKVGFGNVIADAKNASKYAGNEMVIVIAAGNNRTLPYALGNSQMATASENGRLILDGRAIVVGWWDTATNTTFGNQAGSVCVTYRDGACQDAARMQDYYILADGTHTSTWNRGERGVNETFNIRSGSSFAVPVVAGGVAIIHQMWPHMKGKHIVQLLLDTADNQSIRRRGDVGENYNETVHGQGLLDMKAATDPFGEVGIPVTMRTNTTARAALRGGVSLTAHTSQTALADVLGRVMVLDYFDRDFYFDLSSAVASTPTTTSPSRLHTLHLTPPSLAGTPHSPAQSFNYYAATLPPNQHVQFAPITLAGGGGQHEGGVGLASGGAELEAKPSTNTHQLQFGMGTSYDHVLGNRFSGILGTSRHSHTLYGLYNYNYGGGAGAGTGADAGTGAGTGAYGQLGLGVSYTEFDKAGSLLAEAELMVSSTATAGYGFALPGEARLGFSISQPITLERARLHYDVPVARTLAGEVVRESRVVDFKTDAGQRPLDVGVEYQLPLHWGGKGRLSAFAEARTRGLDFGDEATDNRFGVRFANQF